MKEIRVQPFQRYCYFLNVYDSLPIAYIFDSVVFRLESFCTLSEYTVIKNPNFILYESAIVLTNRDEITFEFLFATWICLMVTIRSNLFFTRFVFIYTILQKDWFIHNEVRVLI